MGEIADKRRHIDPESVVAVIFCGGKGTRLREFTDTIPKPLVPVGQKPIVWHIMKAYSAYGVRRFVLCLGYKGEMIKDYFLNYGALNGDFTVSLKDRHTEFHSPETEDWKITLADTGAESETGERLLKVRKYLGDRFFVTYGDGVADVDIRALLEFHLQGGKLATVTGGHPYSKYGMVEASDDKVVMSFNQKPQMKEYINIGFMVLEKGILDLLTGGPIEDTLSGLAEKQQLAMFAHEGFFRAMDTHKDYEDLNQMWKKGDTPWKVWKK